MELATNALGCEPVPFGATLFDKSPDANWLVAWHQDTALPFVERREVAGWGPWSKKAGVDYAHAPAAALSQVVALRVHLDDSLSHNGPLRVLPGTHTLGVLSDEQIRDAVRRIDGVACTVERGGVADMLRAAILILIACLPLVACTGARIAADSERSQVVYVVRRGWHSGVALAAVDWQQRDSPLLSTFAAARYLEFGWGDADFYQADKATASVGISAVLWPSATVMEVVPLQAAPPPGTGDFETVAVHVTNAELKAIVSSLEASFVQPISATGKTYRTAGGEARFFHARGKFYLFRMCNRWTAELLQRAGCAVSPRLTMTAGQVIKAAKKCDAESAGAGRQRARNIELAPAVRGIATRCAEVVRFALERSDDVLKTRGATEPARNRCRDGG